MTAFVPVDPAHAEGKAQTLLAAVKAKLGVIPNMTRQMARAPAVLEAYLGFAGALAGGTLPARMREQIALVTAETNGCEYCLSAHSLLGKGAGLNAADIAAARVGDATDTRTHAALRFARALLAQQGSASDADVAALRAAGFDDGAIGEVIANVALNIFTNYFNNVTQAGRRFPGGEAARVRQGGVRQTLNHGVHGEHRGMPLIRFLRALRVLRGECFLSFQEIAMADSTVDVAFTPTVRAMQERHGSRRAYAKLDAQRRLEQHRHRGARRVHRTTGFAVLRDGQRRRAAVRAASRRPARLPARARRPHAGLRRLSRQPPVHHGRQPRGE